MFFFIVLEFSGSKMCDGVLSLSALRFGRYPTIHLEKSICPRSFSHFSHFFMTDFFFKKIVLFYAKSNKLLYLIGQRGRSQSNTTCWSVETF